MAPSVPQSGSPLHYYSSVPFQSQVPFSGGGVSQSESHIAMNVRSSSRVLAIGLRGYQSYDIGSV